MSVGEEPARLLPVTILGSLSFPSVHSRSHRAPVGLSPHGSYPPYARRARAPPGTRGTREATTEGTE